MNFSKLSLGKKITLSSSIVAFFSMFFHWASLGIFGGFNGFQNYAFILLALFIYPLIATFKSMPFDKVIGIVSAVVGVIASIYIYFSYGDELFGTYINVSSTGLYLFFFSAIGLLVGSVLHKEKVQTEVIEHDETTVVEEKVETEVTNSEDIKGEETKIQEPEETNEEGSENK